MGFAGCNRRVALGVLGSGTTAEAACAQSEAANQLACSRTPRSFLRLLPGSTASPFLPPLPGTSWV